MQKQSDIFIPKPSNLCKDRYTKQRTLVLQGFTLSGGARPGPNWDIYEIGYALDLEMISWHNSITILHGF